MILLRTPLLELARITASASGFPRHTHDEYVISANLGGHEQVWLEGESFVVSPDMLTIYPPQAVQSSHSLSDAGWDCLSLYVDPAAFGQLFDCPPPDLPSHLQQPVFARQLKHIARLEASLREEAIVQLLQTLLDGRAAAPHRPDSSGSQLVQHVRQRLLDDLSVGTHLQQLAAAAGVTSAHLVRRFQQATGLPPLAWQMQQRMALARRLLRAGRPIIDVALATGFADQAHFSKAFSRFCGMSPGRYRQINF
ncbi:AraC family transcriptional regulator [Aquitalea sp. ASV11]|uniref:AraC family transcriptional regulator n=1 Tax=Aquitalea sp. ASV11 TaxID=2795103 RepID=UPI0018EE124D|nr:AraC family transcriptional regulator [Aquitalea sp. ASV11]